MTEAGALTVIGVLQAAYQHRYKPNKHTPALLRSIWSDLDDAAVLAATKVWMAQNEWPPMPSDIRRLVRPPNREPDAAVDHVWAMARANGPDLEPDWDDPVIACVVASIGWRSICETTDRAAMTRRIRAAYSREHTERELYETADALEVVDQLAERLTVPQAKQISAGEVRAALAIDSARRHRSRRWGRRVSEEEIRGRRAAQVQGDPNFDKPQWSGWRKALA